MSLFATLFLILIYQDFLDLEDKVYAIVRKLEREKRGSKRRQVPQQVNRVPIANPKSSNKDKRNNSPYGGLLIK